MKHRGDYIFLAVILLLSSTLMITVFWESIEKVFTGKVSSQPQDVTISVVGKAPVSVYVPNISPVFPIENSTNTILFVVNVSDPNGVNDINDSSITSWLTDGNTTRSAVCSWSQDINKTTASYNCALEMYYYDHPSSELPWTIVASAKDRGNGSVINQTSVLGYAELKSLLISPSSLSWGAISSSDTNQMSDNDPTVIENYGNYNGEIKIIALDLFGEDILSESIPANNFTVSISNGSECSGIQLQHNITVSISGSSANRGNVSMGGNSGREQLYYCIPEVPLVSSQIYSTLNGGSWTVLY